MSTRTEGKGSAGGGGVSSYYVRDLRAGVVQKNGFQQTALVLGTVYYSPFEVPHTITVDSLIFIHGTPAGGNIYAALYDCDSTMPPQPRNRLAISASTPCSGTNRRQRVPFTSEVQLDEGVYFGAIESDNNSDQYEQLYTQTAFFINGPTNGLTCFSEALGVYGAPPAVATPVVIADKVYSIDMRMRVSSIP